MAFQNRPQKAILLGWILPICLLVVLSNPVAGWDFSSLVSFSSRGLRGSPPQHHQQQQDSFVDQQQEEEEEEEDYFEDFVVEDFDAADAGAPQEEIDRERELHPGHSHYGGYGGKSYYGVPYRATNVYRPYNPGYYGGYYRYYGYRNRNYGYYNNQGYNSYTYNRPYNYNRAYFGGGFDDWLDDGPTRSNFWV